MPQSKTPVKPILNIGHVGCFCCFDLNPGRSYNVNGLKWRKEGASHKISLVLGNNSEHIIQELEKNNVMDICSCCLTKLGNTYDFIVQCHQNLDRLQQMLRFKRCAGMAESPQTSIPTPSKPKPKRRACKELFLLPHGDLENKPPEMECKIDSVKPCDAVKCLQSPVKTPVTEVQKKGLFGIQQVLNPCPRDVNIVSKINTTQIPSAPSHPAFPDHAYIQEVQPSCPKSEPKPEPKSAVDVLKTFGVQWNADYNLPETLPASDIELLRICLITSKTVEIVKGIFNSDILKKAVKFYLLSELDLMCNSLASIKNPSVMRRRSVEDLSRGTLPDEIIHEIAARSPFLLDVIATVANAKFVKPDQRRIAPYSLVCSILLHMRNEQLSAMQRLQTLVCVKGHADDQYLIRLNKLGVTLSPTSKLRLLDQCEKEGESRLIARLKQDPFIKLTGDNFDQYVRVGQQSSERHHEDRHWFSTILTFCRVSVAHLPTVIPHVDVHAIQPEDFLLRREHDQQTLLTGYKVMIGRILSSNIQAFSWMKQVLPIHIDHEYSDQMAQPSHIHPLPMVFKNEAKYEDCVEIMDRYEDNLISLHQKAYGNLKKLDQTKCPVGGDQLTRVRLQGAKKLRRLSQEPAKRFDHLHPVVCEMWHNKQDFLHKAYKTLFHKSSERQVGTLYYFKNRLRRTDVNGNVKSNYRAHEDLLLMVGERLIIEQALEFFEMDTCQSACASGHIPFNIENETKEVKAEIAEKILSSFVTHYGYGMFELEQPLPENVGTEQHYQLLKLASGHLVLTTKTVTKPPDHVYNYCMQVCHWALHLMHMNDTNKEGDFQRLLVNCEYNLPFFYGYSTLSKYFVENLDFLLKVKYLLSPQLKMRVLAGAFQNTRGGKGECYETDLAMEHSVRNRKDLVRHLGANKTEKAILRVTNAADTVSILTDNFDRAAAVPKKSSRHSKQSTEKDRIIVTTQLRQVRPFCVQSGRKFESFASISRTPFHRIDRMKMLQHMRSIIDRLYRGQYVEVEEDDD